MILRPTMVGHGIRTLVALNALAGLAAVGSAFVLGAGIAAGGACLLQRRRNRADAGAADPSASAAAI